MYDFHVEAFFAGVGGMGEQEGHRSDLRWPKWGVDLVDLGEC
jgi:hypothetical protein